MNKISFGVRVPNSGPLSSIENIVNAAKAAEDMDFDALWVHDHVVWSYRDAPPSYFFRRLRSDYRYPGSEFFRSHDDAFVSGGGDEKDRSGRGVPGHALPQPDLRGEAVFDPGSSRPGAFAGRRRSGFQGNAGVGRVRRVRRSVRAARRSHRRIHRSDESDLDPAARFL